jgi:hypothetical protein
MVTGVGAELGFLDGFANALEAGMVIGIAAGIAARGTGRPPRRIGSITKPRLRQGFTRETLKFGCIFGLVTALAFGLLAGVTSGIMTGLIAVLLYLVWLVPICTLIVGLARAFVNPDSTSSPGPSTS